MKLFNIASGKGFFKKLSAFSYQLLAFSYQPSAVSYRASAVSYQPSAFSSRWPSGQLSVWNSLTAESRKLIAIFSLFITTCSLPLFSQNMSISPNGAPPDSSAMLDVQSTTQGFLPPRLTIAQRNAITSPADGLMIFQTDSVQGNYVYFNSTWNHVSGLSAASTGSINTNNAGVAYLKDVKTANSDGGTFTSGSWQTRVLNTIEGDTSFVSLSSNQFILNSGTYLIEATVPAYGVNSHKSVLYNVSGGSNLIFGETSSSANSTANAHSSSFIHGLIALSAATTLEIRHRCQTTKATNGYGIAANLGVNELYTQVKIIRLEDFLSNATSSSVNPTPSLDSVLFAGNNAGNQNIVNVDSLAIGTSDPDYPIHALGTGTNAELMLETTGSNDASILLSSPTITWNLVSTPGTGQFRVRNETLATDYLNIDSLGKVGISNTSPDSLLDVNGGARIVNLNINSAYTFPNTDGSNGQVLKTDGVGNLSWQNTGVLNNTLTGTGTVNRMAYFFASDSIASHDDVFIDATNNRIGIGTAAPAQKLHVVGSARVSAGFLANAGTIGTPSFRFDADANTGLYNPGADQLGISAGGVARLLVTTTGLTINSVYTLPYTDGTNGQVLTTNGAGAVSWGTVAGDGNGIYSGSGSLSAATTVTQAANTLAFTSTATNGFSVDGTTFSVDAANNRIGVGTAAPAYPIDVNGAIRSGIAGLDGQFRMYSEQGATDYEVVFNPAAAMTQNTTYTLPVNDGNTSQVLTTDGAGVLSWAAPTGDGNGIYSGSGSLSAATTVTQGANTLAFTSTATNGFSVDGTTFSVDAANNRVGFGTSSPTYHMHLLKTTGTANFTMETQDTNWVQMRLINSVRSYGIAATAYGNLSFIDHNGATNTIRMRLDSTGRFGIGSSNPAYKLDVGGTIRSGWNLTDGQLRIYSEQGATDYEVVFNPNAAMTQTTTYTLPADDGGASQVLTTDGAGVLSWGTVTGDGNGIYSGSGSLSAATTVTQAANTLAFTSTATNGFSVDGTTFSVDAANNRIGVGTAAPAYPIDVNGAIRSGIAGLDGQFRMYSEQGSTDYEVVFNPAAAMTQNTTYTLPVNDGNASQVLTTDGAGVLSWAAPTGDGNGIYSGSGSLSAATTVTQGANTLAFTSTTTNGFSVDGTTFSVDAANNRIGVGTAAPAYPIDVNGAIRSGIAGLDGQFRMYSEQGATDYEVVFNPNAAMTQNTTYTLPANDGAASQVLTTDGAGVLSWGTVAGDNLGNHTATQNIQLGSFWLSGDGGNEGIYVNATGRVGFGTNAPDARFHILDNSGPLDILLETPDTASAKIEFRNALHEYRFGVNPDSSLTINDATAGVRRLIMTATGQFGLAMGNSGVPAYTLDVKGAMRTGNNNQDGQLRIYSEQGATDYEVVFNPPAAMTQSTTYTLPANDGNANDMLISDGSGVLSWGSSSGIGNGIYSGSGSLSGATTVTQAANTLAFTSTVANAFSVDGTTFSVDAANNRVGIGTAAPAATLEVRGTASTTALSLNSQSNVTASNADLATIDFSDNQVATAQARILTERDAASSGATDLPTRMTFFTTKDGTATLSERLRINNRGRVSIGGVAPSAMFNVEGSDTASYHIDFGGTNNLTASGGGILFNTAIVPTVAVGSVFAVNATPSLSNSTNNVTSFFGMYLRPGTVASYTGTATNFYSLYVASPGINAATTVTNAYGVRIATNATAATNKWGLYVDSDDSYFGGNVGIGTTTPLAKLHVNGDNILVGNTYGIRARNAANTGDMKLISAEATDIVNVGGTANVNGIRFDLTGNNDAVVISSAGDVGIGTASPLDKLHVNGGNILVGNNFGLISRNSANTASYRLLSSDASDDVVIGGTNWNNMEFDISGANDAMVIVAGGNVGMGTTAPSEQLEVIGNIEIPAANDYKYATAKTNYTSVSPNAFTANTNPASIYVSGPATGNSRYFVGGTTGTIDEMFADVQLPHGAVVTDVTANILDSDATYNVSVEFTQKTMGGSTIISTLATTAASTGSTGAQAISASSLNITINNSLYGYYLVFNTRQNTANLRIMGVVITYTVTKAD